MKKYFPYLTIISLMIILLLILIFTNSKPVDRKIITIDSLNSFLYEDNQKIEIPIFINDEKFKIDDLNLYQSIKVTNQNESIVLPLELIEVTKAHVEELANDIYYKYYLKFKMPNLTNNFYIEQAFLKIELINNKTYQLSIGKFVLNYLSNPKPLKWISIDSSKEYYNDYQISKIFIELEQSLLEIDKVFIAFNEELDFSINKDILEIDLRYQNLVQTYFPLWLEIGNTIYYLNNYHYSIEYNLLEYCQRILHIYDFN